MNKNRIIEILKDWNFWKNDLYTGIKRNFYLSKIKKFIDTNQITVIMGPRRSGKSFLMRQTVKNLIEKNISKNQTLIINFEDPRFEKLNVEVLENIYKAYLEFLEPKDVPYIFLDEIQEVKDWEKWVRMMHELKKAKIIISGSNTKLLNTELTTLLTGRHLDVVVSPLSFKEFLKFHRLEIKDKIDFISKEIQIKQLFIKYFEFGGFPEIVLGGSKKEILLKYFDDILNKDLIKRYRIRRIEKLKSLANFYLSNTASLITFNSIEKFLEISADTIERFSSYFENAYLLFFLKKFSFKVKEQEKSPRKVYAIDHGLVNAVGFKFSQDSGKIAENLVFLKLWRKKMQNSQIEIYYWKNSRHEEVDFLLKEGLELKNLYQVCYDLSNPKTKKREIKSLLLAMKEFQLNEGVVINQDFEGEKIIEKKKIHFILLWKFLLNND